jgi:hypothetical protein
MKILLVSESPSVRHEIENLVREAGLGQVTAVRGEAPLGEIRWEEFDTLVFERRAWQKHASMYRYFLGGNVLDRHSLIMVQRGRRPDALKLRAGRKDISLSLPTTADQLARALEDSRTIRDQLENAARFAAG